MRRFVFFPFLVDLRGGGTGVSSWLGAGWGGLFSVGFVRCGASVFVGGSIGKCRLRKRRFRISMRPLAVFTK